MAGRGPPMWDRGERAGAMALMAGRGPPCMGVAGTPPAGLRVADDEEADLGHVLDGEAQALAAEAGVLDASVGRVVHAPGRHVADRYAADDEHVPGAPASAGVEGEYA